MNGEEIETDERIQADEDDDGGGGGGGASSSSLSTTAVVAARTPHAKLCAPQTVTMMDTDEAL